MNAFSLDQWLILFLAFLFGLFLGMAMLAGGKWKRRYREEVRRREALEAEHREYRDRYERTDTSPRAPLNDERRADDRSS